MTTDIVVARAKGRTGKGMAWQGRAGKDRAGGKMEGGEGGLQLSKQRCSSPVLSNVIGTIVATQYSKRE